MWMKIAGVVGGVLLGVAACGKSEDVRGPAGGTGATGEKLKQDVKAVGRDLNAAANEAVEKAKPVVEKAKEETREAVHQAAEKVAEETGRKAETTQH